MKKFIIVLLFSSFAMAEWYQINDLSCSFANGTSLKYSISNPTVAAGSFGYLIKQFKTDSKVVYSSFNGKNNFFWLITDPASYRYSLNFDLTPKTVVLNKRMTNVTVTMNAFVPMMLPTWYPAASSKPVTSGSCNLSLSNWK